MLSSNQVYGPMNNRFDRRLRFLMGFGFQYKQAEGIAIVTRMKLGRQQTVAAATLLLASNRIYRDTVLRQYLR